MMILKEIIASLENAAHPVAKALHKGDHFKVLAIGFKKGMVLKEHQAHLPTRLFVLSGRLDLGKSFSIILIRIFFY